MIDEEKLILDGHPMKFDPETLEIIRPDDQRYDTAPAFNFGTLEFEYTKDANNGLPPSARLQHRYSP